MKEEKKVEYGKMKEFWVAMNNMDKSAISMFYSMLWTDIFIYLLQLVVLGVSLFACYWIWGARVGVGGGTVLTANLTYWALWVAVFYGTGKQIIDLVVSVRNFYARVKYVQDAKLRVKNFPADQKKREQQFIEDVGEQK